VYCALGPGRKFFYAGEAGADNYKQDKIAMRGIVSCAPVTEKAIDSLGNVLRFSEKPVPLLQYFITTLVCSCFFHRMHCMDQSAALRHVQVPEDYLIIDPFCGSCAVGEAALRCGRAFFGADIDTNALFADGVKFRMDVISTRLKDGELPDERTQLQIRDLYVNGTTVHHSFKVSCGSLHACCRSVCSQVEPMC
jgi:hypothetical protein